MGFGLAALSILEETPKKRKEDFWTAAVTATAMTATASGVCGGGGDRGGGKNK